MPGKVVSHDHPSEQSLALREVAAPQYMGMAQYQALRRQARRQLLASSWKDIDGQKEANRGEEEIPQGG